MIAERINRHLKRFEADPSINVPGSGGGKPYWGAHAIRTGAYVRVVYVSYQHATNLPRAKAERYAAWLDAGNVGRHYEALREPA